MTSIGRQRVYVQWGAPPMIKTNARVGYFDVGGTRLYFFADRLLIFGRGSVNATSYTDLQMQAGLIRFAEDGAVPRALGSWERRGGSSTRTVGRTSGLRTTTNFRSCRTGPLSSHRTPGCA